MRRSTAVILTITEVRIDGVFGQKKGREMLDLMYHTVPSVSMLFGV